MRKTAVVSCLVMSLVLTGCTHKAAVTSVTAPRPAAPALHDWTEMRQQLDRVFGDPNFLNAQWGVMVQSLDSGEIVYQRNAEKILMPASNMKLPTAASALLRLGADYIYRTRLLATGVQENGVLKGDLWVEGSGDPAICARFNEEDPLRVFRQWAAKLKASGIQRIDGNIIGDDDAFEDVSLGSGWAWDYLSAGYAAEVGALQLNENVIELIIKPGPAPGGPAAVELRPATKYAELTNQAVTAETGAEAEISVDRAPLSNRVSVSGRIPLGSKEMRRSVAVYNPTQYFVQVLKETFESEGISVGGRAVDIDALVPKPARAGATVLLTHESPKLIEILKVLLKESQNLYAETLVKTLGREIGGQGTFAAGRGVVQEVLSLFSVPRESWIMADGSGLSRYNYIAPEQLVRLLRGMYRRKEFPLFFDCLPIAGVDGTLRSRLKGTRAENNVRAKTGSIANVRTLSGYVRTADGEMLAFSMQANNFIVPSRLVEYDQDLALEMLANFSHRK